MLRRGMGGMGRMGRGLMRSGCAMRTGGGGEARQGGCGRKCCSGPQREGYRTQRDATGEARPHLMGRNVVLGWRRAGELYTS